MIRYQRLERGVRRYDDAIVGDAGVVIGPGAGAPWDEYHSWLAIPGNVLDPPPAPPPVSLEYAIAEKVALLDDVAHQRRALALGGVSSHEAATWPRKAAEAQAVLASGDSADAPLLRLEAEARGMDLADLAHRVMKRAYSHHEAEARIAGAAGRHKDAVRALSTVDDVEAYDASVGWPFA